MTERSWSACIVVVVGAVVSLSLGWWASCTFYIGPQLMAAAIEQEGRFCEPDVCDNVDSRSLAVLSALLATLIALKKKTY